MKKIAIIIFIPLFAIAVFSNWKPTEGQYSIKFNTKRASGTIGGLQGKINFDPKTLNASAFDVSVDLATLDMGLGLKTKHAKEEGFFDAEKYPKIYFKSNEIVKSGDNFTANGTLTIKDVSKQVSIPFSFLEANGQATFKGNFQINRLDYNLNRKGVGELVDIEMLIPVTK